MSSSSVLLRVWWWIAAGLYTATWSQEVNRAVRARA